MVARGRPRREPLPQHWLPPRHDHGRRDREHASRIRRRSRPAHIVLTSSGTVLTNNHVIRGADAIRVTVPSTGRAYTATVTGYSVSKDVALLRLRDASALQTVQTSNSSTVRVGDRGRRRQRRRQDHEERQGDGLGQSITISGDDGATFTLPGLIETTTPLRSGDSGGPLLSNGRVIGIDAAASGGSYPRQRPGVRDPDQPRAEDRRADRGRAQLVNRARRSDRLPRRGARRAGRERRAGSAHRARRTRIARRGRHRRERRHRGLRRQARRVAHRPWEARAPVLARQTVRVTWIDPYRGRTTATVRLVAGPPQ